MVNPTIYVSCIKQFWSSVSLKKTNNVVRLQALTDRRKVIITEDTVRQVLQLDDSDSIDCLTNEEIFAELTRMGLVRNVDSSSKFYMYPRFLQLMINAQQVHDDAADAVADDVADDVADAEPTPPSPTPATTPPTQQELIPLPSEAESTPPPSLHQSPIAQPPSPPQQQPPSHDATISMDLLNQLLETCATLTKKVSDLEQDKIAQAIEITKLKQRVRKLEKKRKLKASGLKRLRKEVVAEVTKDADIQGRLEESQAQVYHLDLEHAQKVLSMQDDEAEPAELKKVIKVVTTAKLMTKLVTAATTTITAALMPKASATRRRNGVVIRDPKETATPSVIVHSEPKS
nr:hypothetical protein [Tanacetum cinerariifolium]